MTGPQTLPPRGKEKHDKPRQTEQERVEREFYKREEAQQQSRKKEEKEKQKKSKEAERANRKRKEEEDKLATAAAATSPAQNKRTAEGLHATLACGVSVGVPKRGGKTSGK